MEQWGPVSQALADEVAREARQRGVVVWLDKDGDYIAFTDALAARHGRGDFPVPVVAWRGSHLAVMLATEHLAGGTDPRPLLVHAPGFNEQSVRATPLLELYESGKVYRKALSTLVTEAASGIVRPDAIATFLQGGGVTLEAADAWLAGLRSGSDNGLRGRLRATSDEAVLDDLLRPSPLAAELGGAEARRVALGHWSVRLGLPDGWAATLGLPAPAAAGDVAFLVAAWALCVEYVHDLRRAPYLEWLEPLRDLPKPVVAACTALARHLRARHDETTARVAAEVEGLLDVEVDRGTADDLGQIDTFAFEERRILRAALDAIEHADFATAARWAEARRGGTSFWLARDPERVAAWELVACGAALGRAIDGARGLLASCNGVGAAAAVYARAGAPVDRAHRHLVQRRAALWHTRLPEMPTLRGLLDKLDGMHQAWALELANAFSALCRRAGALPEPSLQQRTLFDEVVRPLAAEVGVTAYFLVDALRYEMAEELAKAIGGPGAQVTLRHRLAELPTESAVGMNALAPVTRDGRLRVVVRDGRIAGFGTAEFQVLAPEHRQRAIQEAVGGESCPWLTLDDVLHRDVTGLKKTLTRARVVVVHSTEIDAFGHKGAGPGMFDAVLQRLRAAWRALHEAGVRRFVVTADHGFLLIDRPTAQLQRHGRRVDARRRYALSDVPADYDGELRVALADLRYDGADLQVTFPQGTTLFDTGQPAPPFVHGGNSLQERVIPVLTVLHRAPAGGDAEAFSIGVDRAPGLLGTPAVRVTARPQAQHGLDFGRPRDVELALRVVNDPEVTLTVVDARDGARRDGPVVRLEVGRPGDVEFRLHAPSERRVRVEAHLVGARAEPVAAPGWFEATPPPGAKPAEPPAEAGETGVDALPDGVRKVFDHLEKYGTIGEAEVVSLLGSAREARKFARGFEEYAALVRFEVRIESVGGVKQYVRRGATS